jgi:outer membrane receptor protein involved in Fe transport
VVENLPGVARSAAGAGTLVVWGSAPQDTRVYVNGVHVPRLYHDGGYRSIVSSDFVQSVELVPGGYGSSYGRGLGGLVTVAYRPLDDETFHGSVAADTIDASAAVRAKVAEHVHVAVAARKSWLDSVLSAVTSEDVSQYVPVPRYWDGQGRVVVDLAPHETIEIGGLASSDRTTRNLINPDPALSTSQTTGLDFQRIYLRYERHLPDSSIIEVVPSWGINSSSLVNQYGATQTTVDNDSNLLGLRAGWRGPATSFLRVSAGLDGEVLVSSLHRSGSIGFPPREGDIYVFGQAPPSQVSTDAWKTVIGSVGAFIEGDFSLLDDTLHVIPGARFEPYFTATNRQMPPLPGNPNIAYSREEPVLEPRIAVRYAFTPRISMKAAYGVYHQAPQPEDMSAQFGTPTLELSTAEHWLVGGTFQLTDLLSAEVTGFLSTSDDLVVRSQSDSPYVAQALDQVGIGRSYGTQFLFRQQKVGPFFGWVSYSILRSERRDAPGLDWRLFDYDQSHVFTALGSYDLGAGYEFGLRFRFSTGYPRTPVIASYYDAKAGAIEPIFGAHNSIRIPSFISLDARVSKRFKVARTEAEVYLDVQNVFNHSNPEEIVYDTRYTQKAYITGFPIMPVLGARWSW